MSSHKWLPQQASSFQDDGSVTKQNIAIIKSVLKAEICREALAVGWHLCSHVSMRGRKVYYKLMCIYT